MSATVESKETMLMRPADKQCDHCLKFVAFLKKNSFLLEGLSALCVLGGVAVALCEWEVQAWIGVLSAYTPLELCQGFELCK